VPTINDRVEPLPGLVEVPALHARRRENGSVGIEGSVVADAHAVEGGDADGGARELDEDRELHRHGGRTWSSPPATRTT
jgi:hypothetical protein